MQELIARQKEIIDNIHKIHSNFNKDSASRKTDSYIKKRISSLDSLWAEFDINHTQLLQSGDDYSGQEYFKKDVFKDTQRLYERIKGLIQNFNPSVEEELNPPTQARPALSDLMSEQKTNFRALQRLINSIDITKIVEKWELEDELKRLQSRWRDIDNLHLKIDNISQGEDETYVQIYCWTDSLVVLGWLQGNPARWKAFVANRTKEILDIVPSSCWRHVSSSDNAADCATRGLTISQLLQHTLWWEGPAWIKDDSPSEVMKLDLPQMEVKRNVHTHTAQRSDSIIEDILNKHSSITYVVRVIARVLRFITNVHHRVVTHSSSSSMKHNTLGIAYDAPDRAPYLTAILIREDNMPPTKWALGRVKKVHPGLDGHVRVATLKTKSGETKRPIIKLIPLPVHTKKDNPDTSTEDERDDYPLSNKRRPTAKVNFVMATMLLLLTFLAPTIDHWKMIVYYNMTTYWHNMKAVEKYVNTISKACQNDSFCLSVVTQFEHELNEINHYNDLLMNNHHLAQRRKRGLINAVGNIANSLFGVLDDKFAQQYEKDIETLTHREDHLLSLYKNQTSILEAENNIMKRNEAIMNKQFDNIYKHLKVLSTELNQIASQNSKIMASWISADVIISNLRRTQETLLDIVTDIYHGRLNVHLLSPQQIQQQLNVISGQLQGDVVVPADNARDLYGLLHVRVTVTGRYLIMEITIPLINRDLFELSKVIELPQQEGNQTYIYTKTETKYLAINVKKDTVIPMTENDIQACIPHTDQQFLCPLSHPIFTMQVGESLCNMQLFTSNENKPYCRPEIKQCSDRWIKLHTRNTWLYSCCTVCSIRIICPNEIVTKTLHHNGLIHLEKGCVIKGEAFLIYAEHDYTNEIYMEPDDTRDLPNSSTLNELISVPLPDKFVAENHNKTFAEIQQKLEAAKKIELPMFTHDHVHYTVIYTILFIVTTLVLTILGWYARVRWYKRKSNESKPGSITSTDETSSLEVRVEPKRKDDSKQTKRTNLGRRTQSNVDIATSPGLPRAIKFNLSASTSNLSN